MSNVSPETRELDYHILENLIAEGVLERVDPHQLCGGGEFVFFQCADEKDTNKKDREYLLRAGIEPSPSAITSVQPLGGVLWLSPHSPVYRGKDAEYVRTIISHYHGQFQAALAVTGKWARCFRGHYLCRMADHHNVGVVHGMAIFHHGIEYMISRKLDIPMPATGYHIEWDESGVMETWHLRRRPLVQIARNRKAIEKIFRDEREFEATQIFLKAV